MAKKSKPAATKKSKPMPFAKSQDGVIGPKNRQDYGKKGRK
jgi:hypothetical protein